MICNAADKDSFPLFFCCPTAVNIWRASGLWNIIDLLIIQQLNSVDDVMFAVLQQSNNNQVAHIATIIQSMWKSRNLRIWQQIAETNSSILKRLNHLLEDWQYANGRKLGHATGSSNNNIRNKMTAAQGITEQRWQNQHDSNTAELRIFIHEVSQEEEPKFSDLDLVR